MTVRTILAGSLILTSACAPAADWPQWQGPKRDNVSSSTGLLKQWPDGGPPLLWKRSGIGAKGYSTVAIAGGLIYTTGSPHSGKNVITALNMNGAVKWQRDNGPEFLKSHGGARATPTIDGGSLYVLSGMGRLGCFDARTGEEKWAVNLVESCGGKVPTWGYSESVLIDGEKVFVTVGGTKAGMAAFNKKTGAAVWQSEPVLAASYCPPLLVEFGGVRQVVTGTGLAFVGVRAGDGKILWRFPSTNRWKVHATTPVFSDGGVFLTSGYGTGSFRLDFTVKEGNVSVAQVWKDANLDNHYGGVVLVDGFIYGYGDRGGWTCLDFKTGVVKWTSKAFGKGSATYADGMLYCYAEGDGAMALVPATPEKFEVVSRFKVPSGGRNPYRAHPVVCDGRLYVRHSDVLYCYDVK